VLDANSFVDKVLKGLALLNSMSPESLILVGHHEDVVAVLLGILYRGGSRTIYIHHGDYSPALGATINFPVHFDTTVELTSRCCDYGLKASTIPLSVKDISQRVVPPSDSGLVLATSGTANKFGGEIGGARFADAVAACISSGYVSKVIHMGDLYPQTRDEIAQKLACENLPLVSFLPIGRVSHVASALIEHSATVYFNSFPFGGATAVAEAQSVGLPVLFAKIITSNFPVCDNQSIFACSDLGWDSINNIQDTLSRVVKDWGRLSDKSYSHYKQHNSSAALKKSISNALSALRINQDNLHRDASD